MSRVLAAAAALAVMAVLVPVGVALSRWGLEAPADADRATAASASAEREPASPRAVEADRRVVPDPAQPYTLGPVEAPEPPAPSYDVAAVQQRLTDLRYYVGAVDGKEGPATRSAVMAFQKVNQLPADGTVGAATLAALDAPAQPVLRGGAADRIEIDLNIQVLHLVRGGILERTMPVSSGNGATYRTSSGGRARSLTPVGHFRIERRIRGVRKAPLGTLFDPMYFYRGWAVHGSNHVPAHPASHGCVRVTRADAVWLFERAPNGMPLSVYGGQHTFPAGSSAPGTDTPAGDVAASAPSPSPSPESAPPQPSPAPAPPPPASPPPAPTPPSPAPPIAPSPAPSPPPEAPPPASTDPAAQPPPPG